MTESDGRVISGVATTRSSSQLIHAATKRQVVVFDIDGTVSDCRRRLHLLESKPPQWERFFASSAVDLPLPRGLQIANALMSRANIVWLTGRPERFRTVTVSWLARQGLPTDTVHMRSQTDRRPVAEFKVERIAEIAEHTDLRLVVDDDDSVVAALRRGGWPVYHAQWATL
ncbi:HAD family acid phosphatase [Nocardia sp. NPDC049737]|uniref:phosphatase domain-containing protein n=1 Tax=Nocardia sp. NPDC049737 TaxID=3154358 RepID=UPI0034273EAE